MTVVNSNFRKILFKKCNGICPECGRKMSLNNPRAYNMYMTVDHIVPKSLGGTNNLGNLRALCRACNKARGSDMTDVVYKINENLQYSSKIIH